MRFLTLLSIYLLLQPAGIQAQTMLHTTEWCAHKHADMALMPPANVTDFRSDSIDILSTTINLNVTDFANTSISGWAEIEFTPKVDGVTEIRLDLLSLTVDSVSIQGPLSVWTYNNQVVRVNFGQNLSVGEAYYVKIFYRGKPKTDISNWGGFYWQSGYAYNLGVGFAADPHNFGRAWFPCFDNFVERSEFTTIITSPGDKLSFCNGQLLGDETLSNGNRRRTWVIGDPIPSYLACMAVGPYTTYKRTLQGELGPVPIEIAVTAADSNKLKGSFANLGKALAAYEHWYGPYRWNKIGYSIVPFNSGAMEHATNIAYMRSAVDGTLASETLMAHELSHHWWGDLATCSTAEDMWLNEGWASFSEHIFLEWVYGKARYIKAVEDNFINVLENAHVEEGGYRAVSGIPHSITYGTHVYNKGAVIAHNLRGYLGDSLFRIGCRAVMDQTQMDDFSSAELRDKMAFATGVNLDAFFDNQVWAPGFTDFTIDSTEITPNSNGSLAKVWVKQRLRGAPALYSDVPLEFSFYKQDGSVIYRTGTVSGLQTLLYFEFPPATTLSGRVWVNTRSRLLQARTVSEKKLTNNVLSVSFTPAKLDIKLTNNPADSLLIRVEHHFSNPDTDGTALPPATKISSRFWVVDGDFPDNLAGTMTFIYDGRGQQDQLDRPLFLATGFNEDSVRLYYRPSSGHTWQEHRAYTKNILANPNDRWGQLRTSVVLKGEYTIGKGPSTVSSSEPSDWAGFEVKVSPNPATDRVFITSERELASLRVFDSAGRLVHQADLEGALNWELGVSSWPVGRYALEVVDKDGMSVVKAVMK